MKLITTSLQGCFILEPKIILDERGYFMESFNEGDFCEAIQHKVHFVQDNQSFSTKGVLRGLHYQVGEHAQAKLIRVLDGEILDVAVDVRPDSETYGKHVAEILSSENQKQIFIPAGFAHGFLVLSNTATLFYKCDKFYHKESEGGIKYDDNSLGIDWGDQHEQFIISAKDMNLPSFEDARRIW